MLKIFLFTSLMLLLGACVPKAEQKSTCANSEIYDQKSRRCIASLLIATPSPIQQVPIAVPSSVLYSVTPTEDVAFTATLGYSDANFDDALTCGVSSLSGINQTSVCACTSGVCTVSFKGNPGYFGAASFIYYVVDNDGQSLNATVNLNLLSVDSRPVATLTHTTLVENVLTNLILPYTDIEGDLATACTVTPASSEVVFPISCTCFAGFCNAMVYTSSDYLATPLSSFTYTVTANGQSSLSSTVVVTITPVNDAPVASNVTKTTTEDVSSFTVTLPFTDAEGNSATSCSVFNLVNLTSSSCVCAGTTCTATLAPPANLNSSSSTFTFDYTITDDGTLNMTSNLKQGTVTVTSVDDAPVANTAAFSYSPAIPTEDTTVTIGLSYTDVDQDLATGCTISSPGNSSLVGTCTCTGSTYPNTCSFVFTPSANLNGVNIASFLYSITTANTTTTPTTSTATATQAIAFSLQAVNDAPTISTIANVTDNEASTIVINNITIDEGGGADENIQNLTISVNSDNPTLISNSQIALSYLENGDASASPLSLTLNPSAMQNGTANITLTVTDNGNPILVTTKTFTLTINSASYLHGGWKNLKALGTKTNHSGSILENPTVTLEWEDFTPQGTASLAGFKVYRATSPGGQNFTTPLACNSAVNTCLDSTTVSSSVSTFIDSLPSNVASGTTYYYVVRPYDTNGIATVTTESYSEIDVPIPPTNMALVHRWIANKEVCGKMFATVDPNNHFRCTYSGPGNSGGFYDFGYNYKNTALKSGHLFVDRFESGCNYSLNPTCTANGCIGNGNPNSVGCNGSSCTASVHSIFYDRSSGVCFYKDPSSWKPSSCVYTKPSTATDTTQCTLKGCIGSGAPGPGPILPGNACNGAVCTASAHAIYLDSANNKCYYSANGSTWAIFEPNLPVAAANPSIAQLPPLIYTTQAQAVSYCGTFGKRLMNRKEHVAASAWDSSLTSTEIDSRETGLSMATNNYCNTMSAIGLTYSSGQVPNTGNEDTLPANSSSSIRTVRTGSQVTSACVSRYGIQDMIGNVREWNIDQFNNCFSGNDETAKAATLARNGIRYSSKRLGDITSLALVINNTATPGNEVITVTQTYIQPWMLKVILTIDVPSTMTAAQLYNLLLANADAVAWFNFEVTIPSSVQTAAAQTSLSGGLNGNAIAAPLGIAAKYVATYGTDTITFTSKVAGTYGNDLTIAILDGSSDKVEVKNGKNIEVTIDGTLDDLDRIDYLIKHHLYANDLVTTSITNDGSTTATSFSQASLTGGGKPTCTAIANTFNALLYPSYLNDLSSYSYSFNGFSGSMNGPGGGTVNIVSWLIGSDNVTYFPSYFHYATGLPSINDGDDTLAIGSDMAAADFQGDQIDVNSHPYTMVNSFIAYGPNRAIASGGGWKGAYDRSSSATGNTGNKAGRYALDLLPTGRTPTLDIYLPLYDQYTGFRCVMEAP
ncbi:MAG: Ig-like domain-containing protein [Bacteriovoracaceae bacterium]